MGFLNFLKPKKGQKGTERLAAALQSTQLPPLPADNDLYSELPNLPEAPETSGLPEIELPAPLKGLESYDVTETGEEAELGEEGEFGQEGEAAKKEAEIGKETAAPLLPNWPGIGKPFEKRFEEKFPEVPELPDIKFEEEPGEETELPDIPSEVPSLRPFEPKQKNESGFGEGLISHGGSHYLSSFDFRTIIDSFDGITKMQKKHHKLTEIKKEENQNYEEIDVLFEDLQRRLMLIGRTLFE